MERIDETMEQEHLDEWSRIRQYEREHPIRNALKYILTILIVGLIIIVFWGLVGVAILRVVTALLSFIVDMLL